MTASGKAFLRIHSKTLRNTGFNSRIVRKCLTAMLVRFRSVSLKGNKIAFCKVLLPWNKKANRIDSASLNDKCFWIYFSLFAYHLLLVSDSEDGKTEWKLLIRLSQPFRTLAKPGRELGSNKKNDKQENFGIKTFASGEKTYCVRCLLWCRLCQDQDRPLVNRWCH